MQADDQAATARSDDAAAPAAQRKPGFSGAPLGKLGAAGDRPWLVTLESLLVPGIAVAVGVAFNPEDPLGVHAEFHWAWLAPVIVALRYGPLAGLGAGAVLLLAWVALHVGHMDQFPQIFFLGGLITVMLVGEFSSLWRARTRRAEAVQYYLDQRLEHLIRQYYLLHLSHDRLEQELIGRPMSMRDALKTLRGLSGSDDEAQILLRLLAQYCQISSAALHPVRDDKLEKTAIATIGSPVAVDPKDPLLAQALETRTLCHVVQATVRQEATRYLVAAPLLDIGGDVYAMLLIDELPFLRCRTRTCKPSICCWVTTPMVCQPKRCQRRWWSRFLTARLSLPLSCSACGACMKARRSPASWWRWNSTRTPWIGICRNNSCGSNG